MLILTVNQCSESTRVLPRLKVKAYRLRLALTTTVVMILKAPQHLFICSLLEASKSHHPLLNVKVPARPQCKISIIPFSKLILQLKIIAILQSRQKSRLSTGRYCYAEIYLRVLNLSDQQIIFWRNWLVLHGIEQMVWGNIILEIYLFWTCLTFMGIFLFLNETL